MRWMFADPKTDYDRAKIAEQDARGVLTMRWEGE